MSLYRSLRAEMMAGGAVDENSPTPEENRRRRRSMMTGVVLLGLFIWLGITNIWSLFLVVGLLISVFLHEVGHFVTAGWAGMKRTQFFMGFGPKLWSFHRGGVEYGVRALPLGAFVRIVGMNNMDPVEDEDQDVSYSSKPYRWRMLVITAGSLMHGIIAIVILLFVYTVGGRVQETGRTEIFAITENSAAAIAGLETGDTIRAVNAEVIGSSDQLRTVISSYQAGDRVTIEYERDGQLNSTEASLQSNPRVTDSNRGFLGVGTESYGRTQIGVVDASTHVVGDLWRGMGLTIQGIVTVINPVNQWEQVTDSAADPNKRPTTVVGITKVAGDIGDRNGVFAVLEVLAAINIFVGIFNLLPLLPFDGGHAAIATYERVRSRKGRRYFADVEKMWPVTVAVMTMLLFLTVAGLYLDITRPF
jgi:membrane-associated protease RseP (regulator of RpoE activity)